MPDYCGVIVESPSKCSKIESFLGEGYKCIATYGHFRDLRSLDSIDFENGYSPIFTDSSSKRDKISALRVFIRRAKKVLLATDDDREGEAIAWHICDRFGLDISKTDRIVFHEITKSAIRAAVRNPTTVDMSIVKAQQARQVLDLLVGFTISPLLWKGVQSRRDEPLSAGRCQSPALRIIHDNQVEIDKAPGEASFATTAYFTSKLIEMNLSVPIENEEKAMGFVEASASFAHIAKTSSESRITKKAPLPFTTSLLQQKASSELKSSPNATMAGCQALYEKGLITYHRTDMQVYAEEFLTSAKRYIASEYGEEFNRQAVGAAEKDEGAQAAHEAIRPTLLENREPTGLDTKQMRIYQLIHRNTLESCMEDAVYSTQKLTVTAPQIPDVPKPEYRRTFEKCVFKGWQIVGDKVKDDTLYDYLKALKKGELELVKLVSSYTIKKLKSHLTEAKLVQALEKAGIGRPSTFSSLVDKIQSRKYVKKGDVKGRQVSCPIITLEEDVITCTETTKRFGDEKGKLIIQDLGIQVIQFLINNFDEIFRYSFTKDMEDKLDMIAQGELTAAALCSECDQCIKAVMAEKGLLESMDLQIDEEHSYIVGKYGPCIRRKREGKTSFLPLKEGVTRAMIIAGNLSIGEIVGEKGGPVDVLCIHEGEPVQLRKGRFGPYLRWKDKNYKWRGELPDQPSEAQVAAMLAQDVKLAANIWLKHNEHGYYVMKRNGSSRPTFITIPRNVDATDIPAVKRWLLTKK